MTDDITLPGFMVKCNTGYGSNQWFNNFYIYAYNQAADQEFKETGAWCANLTQIVDAINTLLKPFNAMYIWQTCSIWFPNEESYVHFLLVWGYDS